MMHKWNEVRRKADKDTFGDNRVIVSNLLSDVNIVTFTLKEQEHYS